jgi:hypothetical protein
MQPVAPAKVRCQYYFLDEYKLPGNGCATQATGMEVIRWSYRMGD